MAATAVPTLTPVPSRTPEPVPTATSTEWTKTYPTKQALVIYGASARTQISQLFIERGYFAFNPRLTLYADGQLIFGPGRYEKQLSQDETELVIAKLRRLGFSQLQAAYEADPESLFTVPEDTPYNPSTPLNHIIFDDQGAKSIIYREDREEYLIQPMKDLVSYLESFSSEGATPYQPDRILVGMIDEEVIPISDDTTAIPWPDDITPASQRTAFDGVLYLEGTEALKLYQIAMESEDIVFSFQGRKFQVYVRPILPHECHIYHFHVLKNAPEQTQPYFSCDDW